MPLGSVDGEATEQPPPASLALALAPWPACRAFKVEKIGSVSRVTPPGPPCQAGYVKPGLRYSHCRKKQSQSIPYIFPIKNICCMKYDVLCSANSASPHAHVERESQATQPSAKNGKLMTLLGPPRPTGGTVSERCYISVVVQQY